jgi:hypothetical protein
MFQIIVVLKIIFSKKKKQLRLNQTKRYVQKSIYPETGAAENHSFITTPQS